LLLSATASTRHQPTGAPSVPSLPLPHRHRVVEFIAQSFVSFCHSGPSGGLPVGLSHQDLRDLDLRRVPTAGRQGEGGGEGACSVWVDISPQVKFEEIAGECCEILVHDSAVDKGQLPLQVIREWWEILETYPFTLPPSHGELATPSQEAEYQAGLRRHVHSIRSLAKSEFDLLSEQTLSSDRFHETYNSFGVETSTKMSDVSPQRQRQEQDSPPAEERGDVDE
jgi:hypothetical protein